MFDPDLGRWMQLDPVGFAAGDANLYRAVENNPANELDPSGLQGVQLGPEPRIIEEGVGEPPDYRLMRPPSVIRGKRVFSNTAPQWDMVRFTPEVLTRVLFKNQKSETPAGKVTQDVEVRAWGTRRFPDGKSNDSGDHIVWVVAQARFLRGKCTNAKNETTDLPDRWKRIGFSLNYGVFLRSILPALDLVTEKMKILPADTWSTFVDRFITVAQAIAGK